MSDKLIISERILTISRTRLLAKSSNINNRVRSYVATEVQKIIHTEKDCGCG